MNTVGHLLARGLDSVSIPSIATYLIMRNLMDQKFSRYEEIISFMIIWITVTLTDLFIITGRNHAVFTIILTIITFYYFMRKSTYKERKGENSEKFI